MNYNSPALNGIEIVFSSLISSLLLFVGIGALVMVVIGGYHLLMAGSDKEGAAKAKNTLTYAVLGVVLAISAWIVLNLIGSFLGIPLTQFSICIIPNSC